MIKHEKVLTRHELYDSVWATPMSQLAKQFNLSDNGLRKICTKYEIPMPKGGYWQKIQYGKTVKKPTFPSFKGEDNITINIAPPKEKPEPSQTFTDVITVPGHSAKFHPLVADARKKFSSGWEKNGTVSVDGLRIKVSKGQFPRACRIMDTLIKALEERGAQVDIERHDQWRGSTYALIDGEKVHFGLREALKIVKPEPDPKRAWSNSQELVPKGMLEFYITDYLWDQRSKWKDHDKTTLEDKITSIINGLWIVAAEIKKRRLEREAEAKMREEARQEEEKKFLALEEEKRRIKILEDQSSSFKKSREIRSLIRAAIKKRAPYEPDSNFAKWVSWASAYADQLDPLK